jgi:UDP-3-O-[3-hydroxymyristoyl] glucosamine N-acyltransferase
MSQKEKVQKASDLAKLLGAELLGDDANISRLSDSASVRADSIVVLGKAEDAKKLTQIPGALVLNQALEGWGTQLIVKDTRLALALLSQVFGLEPDFAKGIHPTAVIHETAQLAEDVQIAAHVVIEEKVIIASGTQVGANSYLGKNVTVGKNCMVYPGVTVYPETRIADRVRLHAGVVIGSDGFGYARGPRGAVKIQHLGNVKIEDDVEVGANTCVDRGTLGETVIGARSKIDNLCQIGHNVQIGSDCLIAGTVAIAGSSSLGRAVILGGGTGVVDHVHIGDGAQVGARSLVTKSIPAGESWNGYPAEPYKKYVRKHYLLGKLERIWQSVKEN